MLFLYIAYRSTITPINSQLSPQLNIYSILTCEIRSYSLHTTTVQSRWTLPNGNSITGINDNSGRYDVAQLPNHQGGYLTRLLIRPTMYSDANTYTCEVRGIRNPYYYGPWIMGQATLQLLCKYILGCGLYIAVFLL